MTKTFKRVCRCEKCGNEAEMTITCSLEPVEPEPTPEEKAEKIRKKTKGSFTCTNCGSEADIWVDM